MVCMSLLQGRGLQDWQRTSQGRLPAGGRHHAQTRKEHHRQFSSVQSTYYPSIRSLDALFVPIGTTR